MTFEEMERTMEFVVRQQAQFASDMQLVRDVQAQFAADMQQVRDSQAQLTQHVSTLTGVVVRLADIQEQAREENNRRFAENERRLEELERQTARTDDRLNILISVVERYFSSRNGGSAAES